MLATQSDPVVRHDLIQRMADARQRTDDLFAIVQRIPSMNDQLPNVTASSSISGIWRPLTGTCSRTGARAEEFSC